MSKLLLVDGHSIAYRAYYGQINAGNLSAPDGTPTGAIHTFFTMFLKYFEEVNPDYVAVLFDTSDPTFRSGKYAAYKANREAMPDALAIQMPYISKILAAMNICTFSKEGFEADDLIGTLAKRFASEDNHVYILSGDRDDFQIIDENISQIYPHQRGKTSYYTPEKIKDEYKITVDQVVTYKALVGDSADNIPGVKGVGKKTAQKLLNQYEDLDEIYANIEDVKGAARKNLKKGKENAYLSYDLAKIDCDVDIDLELENLKVEGINEAELAPIFLKLGFKNLSERLEVDSAIEKLKEENEIKVNVKEVELAELKDIFKEHKYLPINIKEYKADTETVAIDFTYDIETVYLVEASKAEFREVLSELIASGKTILAYDFKKIFKYLEFYPLENVFDISVAAYLLNLDVDSKNDYEIYTTAMGMPAGKAKLNIENNDVNKAYYALCAKILACAENLEERLKEHELYDLAHKFEFPLVAVLAEMENTGIKLDASVIEDLKAKFQAKLDEIENLIFQEAGHEFNINSAKQLAEVLYDELGIRATKKTPAGNYSTAADVLEDLAAFYPIVQNVLTYRKYNKLLSTYTDSLIAEVEEDGRIHSTFHQKLTTTGRLSSSDPNLQNIPSQDEAGRQIKKAFVPQKGYKFLDADYSQIELRILAVLSQDESFLDAFKHGVDVHKKTASTLFNKDIDEITRAERNVAKTVNFSIIYGISPYGLSQDLKISVKQAEDYIDSYYELYSEVQAYMQKQIDFAYEHGYVETFFGRKRFIPELNDKNYNKRKFGERAAMNAPIQGTAADIMKLAMINTQRALNESDIKAKILVQVHDEILLEVEESQIDKAKEILKENMENVINLEIPLEIEVNAGDNWYEAK